MLSLWQEVMVDLINTADPAARAAEVEALGVDIVCVHTAFDVQVRWHELGHKRPTVDGASDLTWHFVDCLYVSQHHSDPLQELRAVRGAVDRYVVPNPRSLASVYSLRESSDRVLVHECRGPRRVSDLTLSSS